MAKWKVEFNTKGINNYCCLGIENWDECPINGRICPGLGKEGCPAVEVKDEN